MWWLLPPLANQLKVREDWTGGEGDPTTLYKWILYNIFDKGAIVEELDVESHGNEDINGLKSNRVEECRKTLKNLLNIYNINFNKFLYEIIVHFPLVEPSFALEVNKSKRM